MRTEEDGGGFSNLFVVGMTSIHSILFYYLKNLIISSIHLYKTNTNDSPIKRPYTDL